MDAPLDLAKNAAALVKIPRRETALL